MNTRVENGIWRAVSYTRLSKEDQVMGESDSIVGQKKLIEEWAHEQENVILVGGYSDDGFSGANFERPGFKRMMNDAGRREFDTIIVKDLSRFGRSYLDCGGWIERLLPSMGIRLYSISDNFNSMAQWDYNTALLLPIKNLMNEMHVITTSEKVRTSLDAKRRRGEFVGNFAPYGYRKDPNDSHHLVIDEDAAEVVQLIFLSFSQGASASAIARNLNREQIPSPAVYRKRNRSDHHRGFAGMREPQWHAETVMRILRNDTYLGNLVQGRTRKANWRTKKAAMLPRDEWVVTEHVHEAIVDPATQASVHARLCESRVANDKLLNASCDGASKALTHSNGTIHGTMKRAPALPDGVSIVCGFCGAGMRYHRVRSNGHEYQYFICANHRRDTYSCKASCVRAKQVYRLAHDVYENICQRGSITLAVAQVNSRFTWSIRE